MAAAAPFQWSLAALETLMAEDQMDQHGTVLRAFSVVELWRLRRVCRAFHLGDGGAGRAAAGAGGGWTTCGLERDVGRGGAGPVDVTVVVGRGAGAAGAACRELHVQLR